MFRSSTCWLVGMNTRHWSGIKTQIPATPSAALEHTLVGTLWAAALAHTASTRAAFWATGTVCARESTCYFVHSPLRCCPVCAALVPGALMNSRIYYIENSRKLLGHWIDFNCFPSSWGVPEGSCALPWLPRPCRALSAIQTEERHRAAVLNYSSK